MKQIFDLLAIFAGLVRSALTLGGREGTPMIKGYRLVAGAGIIIVSVTLVAPLASAQIVGAASATLGTSDVIALSSAFIAMLALGVSVWTIVADQRHNRLSVRPRLAIHRYFDQGDWCGLYISNLGLGPAIVQSFELKIDGEPTPSWNHALTRLGFGDEMGDLMTRTFKADDAIAEKDTGPLIRLAGGAKNYDARREKLQSALKRLGIRISYESMYRESHVLAWP